jgi:hypothetical protein
MQLKQHVLHVSELDLVEINCEHLVLDQNLVWIPTSH